MEILIALAIAPFLAALVLGAREAELDEQSTGKGLLNHLRAGQTSPFAQINHRKNNIH